MSKYQTDHATREALIEFRSARGLTNSALGKLFSVSPTFISKYLNDNLDRDPEDFAPRVADTLRSIAARLDLSSTIHPNILTEEFTGRVNLARRTQDVDFFYGPAGTGKTCCCIKYQRENPSTIYHKITGRSCSASDLEAGVFAAMKNREGFKANQRRWPYMVAAMKGNGSAILIDNAHRLDRSGRDWGFDFNEETGMAVIFVGNPEMAEKINSNDQQQSRVGCKWEATWCLDPKSKKFHRQLTDMARLVAVQFSDESFAEEIADLADYVARHDGVLRSVRKTVILARELAAAKKLSPRQAFREAHRNLVRNYNLPAD
jgi:DNA transposition AAA+ family ATPase